MAYVMNPFGTKRPCCIAHIHSNHFTVVFSVCINSLLLSEWFMIICYILALIYAQPYIDIG